LNLRSSDNEPVAFFHTNGLNLHQSSLLINTIKHTEAVVWAKAEFPCRFEWRGCRSGFRFRVVFAGSNCKRFSISARMSAWYFASIARKCSIVA
jgi:hypothetical protein